MTTLERVARAIHNAMDDMGISSDDTPHDLRDSTYIAKAALLSISTPEAISEEMVKAAWDNGRRPWTAHELREAFVRALAAAAQE